MKAPARGLHRSFLSPAVKEELTGWLFAMPWLIGFLLFTVGPMLFSLYTSFTEYNIIKAPEWIGFKNYYSLFFKDPFFYKSLGNTFWMVIVKTPSVVIISVGIALLLNVEIPGEKFFRSIIYLPNVMLGIAAILFQNFDAL